MSGSSADLHWGQHCEEPVPGATQGRRPSHVQGQADGCEEQEAPRGAMLQASLVTLAV